MKNTQNLLTDQVLGRNQTLARGTNRESASASLTPPSGVGNRKDSLLYLSCFNSDKRSKKESKTKKQKVLKKGDKGWQGDDWTPDSKEYKIVKSLRENIKHWGKLYGVERLFMNTLTFDERITDAKEAQRRFNNYNRQFSRVQGVTWLYKGIEPQKNGSLHFHVIGYADWDLGAETFDWESYKKAGEAFSKGNKGLGYKWTRIYSKSANDKLKFMWEKTRAMAKGSKMGRSEFLPVRSVGSIGQYVGKYLAKTFASKNNGTWAMGLRRFSYSRKAPQIHGRQFSWVKGSHGHDAVAPWRVKVKFWAHSRGVKDPEDMVLKYGKTWAINYKDEINSEGALYALDPTFKDKEFGWLAPAKYPTGYERSPIYTMWTKPRYVTDFIDDSEDKQWDKWLGSKHGRGSLREHAQHLERWKRAEKEKAFNEKVYG
jgi:hypothetical protein